jgi:hypothetical protein
LSRRKLVILGVGLALGLGGRGLAQEKQQSAAEKGQPTDQRRSVLRPGELKVQGEAQKPKATPLTPPTLAVPSEFDHVESFVPKVFSALDKDPF